MYVLSFGQEGGTIGFFSFFLSASQTQFTLLLRTPLPHTHTGWGVDTQTEHLNPGFRLTQHLGGNSQLWASPPLLGAVLEGQQGVTCGLPPWLSSLLRLLRSAMVVPASCKACEAEGPPSVSPRLPEGQLWLPVWGRWLARAR